MTGGVAACLREEYGCTRKGESVKLSRAGLWTATWSLELSDASGSFGTGSGVNRFRSSTTERLDFAATSEGMN
jgi:hypothetical protein